MQFPSVMVHMKSYLNNLDFVQVFDVMFSLGLPATIPMPKLVPGRSESKRKLEALGLSVYYKPVFKPHPWITIVKLNLQPRT
jgi:hypothetical protein